MVTFGVLYILKCLGAGHIIQLVVPIMIAIPVYAVMALALKAVSVEEAASLPLIGKYVRRIVGPAGGRGRKNKASCSCAAHQP